MSDIRIENFIKNYGETVAVNDVSLVVEEGELFGLIGPDGAGKTTLMRTVATLLIPSSGTVYVQDMDVVHNITAIRRILGYMPQRFSLYQDLSVEQNLQFFADLFQVPDSERKQRLAQLYSFSRLEAFKSRAAGALSGGMKQKLALSCALIHRPDILILDEPTFGVDPLSRQEFWQILRSIQKEGTTILVSTAYMDEANLCDRIALLFNGQIIADDTPQRLRKDYIYPLYRINCPDIRTAARYFSTRAEIHSTQLFGDALHVSFYSHPPDTLWQSLDSSRTGGTIQYEPVDPSIEDIFLNLMGKSK